MKIQTKCQWPRTFECVFCFELTSAILIHVCVILCSCKIPELCVKVVCPCTRNFKGKNGQFYMFGSLFVCVFIVECECGAQSAASSLDQPFSHTQKTHGFFFLVCVTMAAKRTLHRFLHPFLEGKFPQVTFWRFDSIFPVCLVSPARFTRDVNFGSACMLSFLASKLIP